MLAAALSTQETSLSGLAATSDTLLSAAALSFCRGVSCSYTYYKKHQCSSTHCFWLEWEKYKTV